MVIFFFNLAVKIMTKKKIVRASCLPMVDDIKNKRKVGAFFLPLPFHLPFIAPVSLFFGPFTWPGEGLKV